MNELLLITHFVGLSLGVGASFALFTLAFASKSMPADERAKFMLRAVVVSKNASIGLGLLILSGVGMLLWRGPAMVMRWGGPAFHAKLTLVVVMVGVFGYVQVLLKRARLAGGGPALASAAKLSRLLLVLGVSVIALAVIAFK
ncbi:MAG TPA: hypothetical protein VGM29_08280 [Polyangiaceae bacterium]|jgi:uncharacterized membrane protein